MLTPEHQVPALAGAAEVIARVNEASSVIAVAIADALCLLFMFTLLLFPSSLTCLIGLISWRYFSPIVKLSIATRDWWGNQNVTEKANLCRKSCSYHENWAIK